MLAIAPGQNSIGTGGQYWIGADTKPDLTEKLLNNDERKSKVISLIVQSGFAPTAAARHIGVDTTTAMTWAASAGIATKKRPSKIGPSIKEMMVQELRLGVDKSIVAKLGGVSIESITRLLGTEVGLRENWTRARFQAARDAARKLWVNTILSNPYSGIKAVRLIEPAAFAWLYRNDREWLDIQSALIPKQVHGNNSRLNWDERDVHLAQLVRESCLQIAFSNNLKRIKLWQIYQHLPDLKAKLAKLDRLPLTKAAIDFALTTRK